LFFLPPPNATLFLILIGISGFGHAAYVVTFWSMLPDTVEVGEWRTGTREEALIYGVNQLVLKAGSALGIAVLGVALDMIGYEVGTALDLSTVEALPGVAIGLPLGCLITSIIIISFYRVDRALHSRLVIQLENRCRKAGT
ncbi:MAG: MFS transporter, partial [Pseudomonadota bacterium]